MSKLVICAKNVSKAYRLYKNPKHRLIDLLGFLRNKGDQYFHDHLALDKINLNIYEGEKVSIIGRNGAGKSTFLKLITKVITPTSGTLDLYGQTHALLQIGTGFHPEFTGRENVMSYLAHMGVTGVQAQIRMEEIIDFAELEEYIDQPIKTYSTGMGMRLMFAASTSIEPNLLVIDEVLGVGDAYFAKKSYERIEKLCKRNKTTLILVTHDIYSAAKLCERMIWIDKGRIKVDASPPEVTKIYEDSIRIQEEARLRKKVFLNSGTGDEVKNKNQDRKKIIMEIKAVNNNPQSVPIYFCEINLLSNGDIIESLPLKEGITENSNTKLIFEGTCWGEDIDWQGKDARPMLNYGSPFHKVSGLFEINSDEKEMISKLEVQLKYWLDAPCDVEVILIDEQGAERSFGLLSSDKIQCWTEFQSALIPQEIDTSPVLNVEKLLKSSERLGSGKIVITDVEILNENNEPAFILPHRKTAKFILHYDINDPSINERCDVYLSFHKNGVDDVCRLHCTELLFSGSEKPKGKIVLELKKMPLGVGHYTVTCLIATENYFANKPTIFYSLNPDLYICLSKFAEIEIVDGGVVGTGTSMVYDGTWVLE